MGVTVMTVLTLLFRGPAPAVPGPPRLLEFRLPYLAGDREENAANLARHGAPGAPLLIFLPGTGAAPAHYSSFLRTASSVGYSVLGLDYYNLGRSLTRTCGPVAACYGAFQRNRLDGSAPSRFSQVEAENSIVARLRAALSFLRSRDTGGGWTRFLHGSRIAWSRVVVAGHSQGGAHAAFIAHRYRVRGVLMFASPVMTYRGTTTAAWVGTPGRTPVSRMYGLDAVRDVYSRRILPTWAKLGMGSAGTRPARPAPTGAQALLTSLPMGNPRQAHGRVISDHTPRGADGTPQLEPTWRWMLTQLR